MKKDNEIMVKYHNDLNLIKLNSLKDKELELFYAICVSVMNRGTKRITLDITDFIKSYNLKIRKERFENYVKNVHEKFLSLRYNLKEKGVFVSFNFFNYFKTDLNDNTMIIEVNEEFIYLLNNLAKIYTKFNFLAFQKINSKYAKILFPYLQQWNSKKQKEFTKEELFDVLGVKENYRKDLSNFNRIILNTMIRELRLVFKNIKCKKNKKGKEIVAYTFIWEDEKKLDELNDIIIVKEEEIEISQSFKNIIERYKKYNAFKILENEEIVIKLIKDFGEERATLILDTIFNKNKNNEIKTYNYFKKINEELNKIKQVKLVTKKEKAKQEQFEEIKKVNLEEELSEYLSLSEEKQKMIFLKVLEYVCNHKDEKDYMINLFENDKKCALDIVKKELIKYLEESYIQTTIQDEINRIEDEEKSKNSVVKLEEVYDTVDKAKDEILFILKMQLDNKEITKQEFLIREREFKRLRSFKSLQKLHDKYF